MYDAGKIYERFLYKTYGRKKDAKYHIGQELVCIPGMIYENFLNKKYTVNSVHFDEDYLRYKYGFDELDVNIYESSLATIEELRDIKIEKLLNKKPTN